MAAVLPLPSLPVDVLPSYTRRSVLIPQAPSLTTTSRLQDRDHAYHLVKNGKKWLTLSFRSPARGSDELPRFSQGQPLAGSVTLRLSREAVVRSVSVSVSDRETSLHRDRDGGSWISCGWLIRGILSGRSSMLAWQYGSLEQPNRRQPT